ncbi:hypothetical protein BOTBODRAFT_506318 [Botryobasidium botryosum FD-172 SS1]|uniref:F-box domain-containing protein n=1 Tax=Botryobasidium botryosum (strain FD-172 SS1) TaxID=930990 RepID=A0A067MDH2_BOTB1|nr:hypothetical protein BOTBODRAFT_506318 [Botryobasidium botryosum FD-172 SS1]
MNVPRLPVEVIGRILEMLVAANGKCLLTHRRVNRTYLVPLCRVSRFFQAEVERLLYARIIITHASQAILCFRTLLSRPDLARAVRNLQLLLPIAPNYPLRQLQTLFGVRSPLHDLQPLPLRGFAHLIKAVLRRLPNIKSYTISCGAYSFYQDEYSKPLLVTNAAFKLETFNVSLDITPSLVHFLQSQPTITQLCAPYANPKVRFPTNCLPNLTYVSGSTEFIRRIVPGRPVKSVSFSEQLVPRRVTALVAKLKLSTGPMRALRMPVSSVNSLATHVLPIVASQLPTLQALQVPCRRFADMSVSVSLNGSHTKRS